MISLPTIRPLTPAAVHAHFDALHAELVEVIDDLVEKAEAAVDARDVELARELLSDIRAVEADRDFIESMWTPRTALPAKYDTTEEEQ